jgi:hypothetical protein
MTDQEHLERACRRLLAAYPREFRRENEQEILAVLMAGAPPGQRRPGLAESADLIRSGLWLRLRPSVPRSARTVRAAVKLMYAGAVVSTVNLIILMAEIGALKRYHAVLGYRLTAAQVSQVNKLFTAGFVTLWIVWCLVPVALWLWMAQACGRGRNWARNLSTVLFGVATLDLTGAFSWPPGNNVSLAATVLGPAIIPVLYWLVGLAVVWLLWRPASRAYFRPPGLTRAQHRAQMAELGHQAQMAEVARIRSSRAQRIRSSGAQMPRHV